jgi:hypothetical protein
MVVCINHFPWYHYIVRKWDGGGGGGGCVADVVVKGLGPGYGLGWDTTSEFRDRLLGYWGVPSCYMLGV